MTGNLRMKKTCDIQPLYVFMLVCLCFLLVACFLRYCIMSFLLLTNDTHCNFF